MESNIIDKQIYEDLISQVDAKKLDLASKLMQNKAIEINKITYDNKQNFEVHSIVKDEKNDDGIIVKQKHKVYIKVAEGEIENLSCTCDDYKENYCACEHIIATVKEFASNSDYVRIFSGERKESRSTDTVKERGENYKIFNQLVNEFYRINEEEEEQNTSSGKEEGFVHIEPKIICSRTNNSLKLEIKLSKKDEKQGYKVKSLPEFYDRFASGEKYKYGAKLEFAHTREKFVEEDRNLLDFILKYSEIIKYANESSTGYDYYTKRMGEDAIVISNTGLDDLFECLKNRAISMEDQFGTDAVVFVPNEPDIKFKLEENDDEEYKITVNVDIYAYMVY